MDIIFEVLKSSFVGARHTARIFDPNYELKMEFSGLARTAKHNICTRHLEKENVENNNKKKKKRHEVESNPGRTH